MLFCSHSPSSYRISILRAQWPRCHTQQPAGGWESACKRLLLRVPQPAGGWWTQQTEFAVSVRKGLWQPLPDCVTAGQGWRQLRGHTAREQHTQKKHGIFKTVSCVRVKAVAMEAKTSGETAEERKMLVPLWTKGPAFSFPPGPHELCS